jgi:hypothetical protein
VGRGQVGAEVGALTQPAETMGRGLTQRVGTYQQRGKKKNLQARMQTEGMHRKKERKGRVTLGKECQQRKKKESKRKRNSRQVGEQT